MLVMFVCVPVVMAVNAEFAGETTSPTLPAAMLKSGCRWVDCPPEYGPAKTVYDRFNRWSAQGILQSIFEAVAEPAEPPERMALDSTHIKAHRCAGGGKGGRRNRRLASPRAGATARFTALSISCAARGS